MSLLQQNSQEMDDAARGESFTKGTSHVVWASVVAIVLVSIAVGVYMMTGEKPPPAAGQVLAVWAVPRHTETSGFDASGARIPTHTFDEVLVFARIKLHNQTNYPLHLNTVTTNVSLADGVHTSYAASKSGYNDIFVAYPGLQVPHDAPLPGETTLQPGQTIEGSIVSSFRMDKKQWDARKDLYFSFGFEYQPSLKLTPQSAIILDR